LLSRKEGLRLVPDSNKIHLQQTSYIFFVHKLIYNEKKANNNGFVCPQYKNKLNITKFFFSSNFQKPANNVLSGLGSNKKNTLCSNNRQTYLILFLWDEIWYFKNIHTCKYNLNVSYDELQIITYITHKFRYCRNMVQWTSSITAMVLHISLYLSVEEHSWMWCSYGKKKPRYVTSIFNKFIYW